MNVAIRSHPVETSPETHLLMGFPFFKVLVLETDYID
jgi:hypothetical protein